MRQNANAVHIFYVKDSYAASVINCLGAEITMSDKTTNHIGDTVRVLRPPPRVYTDNLGKNVWMGDIEPVELELEDAGTADPYNSSLSEDPWARARVG